MWKEELISRLEELMGSEIAYQTKEDGLEITLIPHNPTRPRDLVIIAKNNSEILIDNVVSYTRAVKPKQITRILRNIVDMSNVNFDFELVDGRKGLSIRFFGNPIEMVEDILLVITELNSELPFLFPTFMRQEFARFGFQFGETKIIIFDVKASEYKVLEFERPFIKYPIITVPDEDGRYYSSSLGIDYLYFPVLSIVSEPYEIFKVYKPRILESGEISLVSWDFRKEIAEIASLLKKYLGKWSHQIVMLQKIAEKPYSIKKDISILKNILESLESSISPKYPLLIYRGGKYPLTGSEKRVIEKNESLSKILERLRELVDTLSSIIKMDEKIAEAVIHRRIVQFVSESMITAMYKLKEQKIRKLQKFGAGFAVYLSSDEVKAFLGNTAHIKISFCEDINGRPKIIIEPQSED